MIFTRNNNIFPESNKERNLYYKVFAGCIFNELINKNNLPNAFIEKLKYRYNWTSKHFSLEDNKEVYTYLEQLKSDFKNNKLNVSFDYHINRIDENSDRGELADIFINGTNTFVAIEAKYLEKYEFKKDIMKNRSRIKKAMDKSNYAGIEVLLIQGSKLEYSVVNYNALNNYMRNEDNQDIPFIIIFWEDILDIIKLDLRMWDVCDYLSESIELLNINDEDYTCEFAEKRWDLFEYSYEYGCNKIKVCTIYGHSNDICDAIDNSLCSKNTINKLYD